MKSENRSKWPFDHRQGTIAMLNLNYISIAAFLNFAQLDISQIKIWSEVKRLNGRRLQRWKCQQVFFCLCVLIGLYRRRLKQLDIDFELKMLHS